MATDLPRTPFARIFTECNAPHHFDHDWNGLPICGRCNGSEGSRLATCPLVHMTVAESDIVYAAYGDVCTEFRELTEMKRAAGLDHDDAPKWERGFLPTIAEYNARARIFNDNLIDLTLAERANRAKRVAKVIVAGSEEVVEMTLL